jgi:putative Mg2+ transporter-C (MgtC) family protein
VSLAEFTLRLASALGAGILIGAERQFLQRMAGLRTNALVAAGAALFVALGPLMGDKASPDRVAANIVTGVGFLGAGVLIREGPHPGARPTVPQRVGLPAPRAGQP